MVKNILDIAKAEHKKAVRLDVLGACKAAECLYTSCGFQFVEAVLNKIVRWINTFFPSEVFIIHIVSMNILDHIPIKFSG